jgi:hypothetical protein
MNPGRPGRETGACGHAGSDRPRVRTRYRAAHSRVPASGAAVRVADGSLRAMLALLTDEHFEELVARCREWGTDNQHEVWSGVHHFPPVGRHSQLQQALATLMLPAARERGLVAVIAAFEPREAEARGGSRDRRSRLRGDRAATAALAVEIRSAEDELEPRLAAFAADRVDELVVGRPGQAGGSVVRANRSPVREGRDQPPAQPRPREARRGNRRAGLWRVAELERSGQPSGPTSHPSDRTGFRRPNACSGTCFRSESPRHPTTEAPRITDL